MTGSNPNSEAADRPKGEGEALRGNPFPRAPGGSRVAAGVKEAKPRLSNENSSQKGCRIFCLVDYYDKLSNLLDAIRALNIASREMRGRD